MCTALNAAKKVRREVGGGPLGLAVATNASPAALAANGNDPLEITPVNQIGQQLS
jgi:hypothetical protein